MEANEAKKPKRPRIGQAGAPEQQGNPREGHYENRYNTQDATTTSEAIAGEGADEHQQGGYQPRQGGYHRQGGYQRPYNPNYQRQGGYQRQGYQRQGGYQQRPYQQRPYQQRPLTQEGADTAATDTDTTTSAETNATPQQGGYQPRQGGYQRQGYQQRSYNPNYQRQGGYNNRGGYGQRQQGGYQPRQQQGGYQRHGGYNNQGGYGPQGGYQPRQGGYQRQQGGYNNQGGYGRQQGGYNNQGGYGTQNRRPNGPGNRYQKGPVRQGKSFTPRPKRIEYELPLPDPDEKIRLNKFMANAGICSRREADEFIQQGLVKVNGQVVTELGTKIAHDDTVEYDDKVVALESKCYILLNKPKDCVTTSDDPNGRTTVLDLVKGACNERIYPVGRLDRNTTGVLLLTNDGDLASKLTHPKYVKKKIYHVWTDKDITEEDMQRIADGIELEDGPIHADAISYATETDRNQAGIEIHSGRNRIVRRIFESLGYHVTKLDRVYFAGLTKKNLPRGRWRYLTQEEVNYLKMGSFE